MGVKPEQKADGVQKKKKFKVHHTQTTVGWLVDFIYPDPSQFKSDMQDTTTIYLRLCTCRMIHFLKRT